MSDDKKYSFISVDTGSDLDLGEPSKVRTTHDVIDGEDTFVVSSTPVNEAALDLIASEEDDPKSTVTSSEVRNGESSRGKSNSKGDSGSNSSKDSATKDDVPKDDSEEVPFQRMQTIIIISLAVLIVAFFLYFNFLR